MCHVRVHVQWKQLIITCFLHKSAKKNQLMTVLLLHAMHYSYFICLSLALCSLDFLFGMLLVCYWSFCATHALTQQQPQLKFTHFYRKTLNDFGQLGFWMGAWLTPLVRISSDPLWMRPLFFIKLSNLPPVSWLNLFALKECALTWIAYTIMYR